MGIFFFWSEKHLAKYPLIPLTIFQSKSNVACLLLAFFHDYVGAILSSLFARACFAIKPSCKY